MVAQKLARKILMWRADHYDVRYYINPWMKKDRPINKQKALGQWERLKSTIENCGAKVFVGKTGTKEQPDIVFAANAALIYQNKAYLARFEHAERSGERAHFEKWFRQAGYDVLKDEQWVFEGAGDAKFAGPKKLFCGYGIRTEEGVYEEIARMGDFQRHMLHMVDQRFYHLDTMFCPLNDKLALLYPKGLSPESLKRVENNIEVLGVPEKEALALACNAIPIHEHVILPSGCPETVEMLRKKGFQPHSVDVSEFIKGGGAVRCLTLDLE